jgi:hypothetical protein
VSDRLQLVLCVNESLPGVSGRPLHLYFTCRQSPHISKTVNLSRRRFLETAVIAPALARLDLSALDMRIEARDVPRRRFTMTPATLWPPSDHMLYPAQVWRAGSTRLDVRAWGYAPAPLEDGWFGGEGFAFSVSENGGEEKMLFGNSEADFPLRYTITGDGHLMIIQQTWDPEQNEIVPFMLHWFDLFDERRLHRRHAMLRPKSDESRLPSLEALLDAPKALRVDRYEEIERTLFLIRNVGVNTPRAARTVLERHRNDWWCDGALAESWASVLAEVGEVERVEEFG